MLDAIVVGAGIGGLVAAVELAARGKRVAVLESASEAGGKIAVARIDGVEVDTGPSLLTWPAVLEAVFARAGADLAEHLRLLRPEPACRYLWPDGTRLDIGRDRESTIAEVRSALGSGAASDLAAFLDHAAAIWRVASAEFIEQDAPDFFALLRRGLPGLRAARQIDAFSTMRAAILDRVESPHLRAILLRFATYAGSDPRRTPATLCSIAHVEMGMGAFGVRGGMIEIVRALELLASRLGVELCYGANVESLAFEGRRCSGVVLAGGERRAARIVVSNADVGHLRAALLPPDRRRALDAPREPTTSGLNLVVRDTRRAGSTRRAGHTVVFSSDPEAEVIDLFDRRLPPARPTVYACAQEVAHERAGWPTDEPIFLMANAPALQPTLDPGPRRGRSAGERDDELVVLEHEMLARLSDHDLLGPHARIVWRRTPAELAARFPDSRGALYGPASHGWNAAFKRTPNALAEIPGLYVASGSAHPGGGIPLAALSGRSAARAALKELE